MLKRLMGNMKDIWDVFAAEVRRVFSDKTTVVIFFLATAVYPPLYYYIYHPEMLTEMPVAVVDLSQGTASKRFAHKLDATPEVEVAYRCASLADAEELLRRHEVKSIFLMPKDYDYRVAHNETATVTVVTDISSFIYYKNALMGGSNVLIDEMQTTQLEHQAAEGVTGEQAETTVQPVGYDDVKLYNPGGGYASYFIPALLMLVVHQTLFFGICVLCGDANENRKALRLIPPHLRGRSVYRVTAGRALCFMLIYFPITLLDLWLIPHWFGMPQLGRPSDVMMLVLPYVIAITCFAMTMGNLFARERLSMLLCCLFFSVILFFLSGVVWPQSNMPRFWLVFSYLFPSTPGIQGFVRISSMGATLAQVRGEYLALWVQAGVYFVTACLSLRFIKRYRIS
ncbi:MAG: ABC transporter permease [Bacteroidales bacterium]|nr:ABC transporter permease [Bacteroidales bacterium]